MRRLLRRSLILAAMSTGIVMPDGAPAASCAYTGPGGGSWDTAANWSCNEVPDSGDSVTIATGDNVSVSAAETAGSVLLRDTGILTFSGGVTLAVSGAMTAEAGTVQGQGTMTVAGVFSKTTSGQLGVRNNGVGNGADLVLNGTGTLDGGAICVSSDTFGDPDSPNLHVNNTFTLATGADANPFPCTDGPRVRINSPNGHLVKSAAGTMNTATGIVNDDTITVQAGTLNLGGPSAAETNDGAYIANDGTTLGLNSNISVGATGRVGGAGTISVNGLNLTMAAGSTLDPAVLTLVGVGTLDLNGNTPVTLPVLNLNGAGFQATLDSERPVTATAMSVNDGTIRNNFTLTVPSGGSFTKNAAGTFFITSSGAQGSADLVLDVNASLDAGAICLSSSTFGDPDPPNLRINRTFTIGSGAGATPFLCGGNETLLHVNGPSGLLKKTGTGTTTIINAIDVAGGRLSVANGQAFALTNGLSQSSGATAVASGGTLQGNATLTGGALEGRGQVTGNVTNTAGTVAPGPGSQTLTVTGNYTQGSGGTLAEELDGTSAGSFDVLSVGGTATLGGTLHAQNTNGFNPSLSDTFEIVHAASRTGTFATLSGAQNLNHNRYVAAYDADSALLGVESTVQPGALTLYQGLEGESGHLTSPRGVTVDEASGDVFVADTGGHRIVQFTAAGAFVRTWGRGVDSGAAFFEVCTDNNCLPGTAGADDGELNAPVAIAADGVGNLYVVDANHRVSKFTTSGDFVRAWGRGVRNGGPDFQICGSSQLGHCLAGAPGGAAGQLDTPSGVTVDGAGNLFVADTGNHRVSEFTPDGGFIRAWGRNVHDDGGFQVCTAFCHTGSPGSAAGEMKTPKGIVANDDGDLLVADTGNHRVTQYTSAGAFVRSWGFDVDTGSPGFQVCAAGETCQSGVPGPSAGQVDDPAGVAADRTGKVYVSDTDNNRIGQHTNTGAFAGAFTRGWGFGVDTGAAQHQVCTTGSGCQAGVAGGDTNQLDSPAGMVADCLGSLYVADPGNDRVQRFGEGSPALPPCPVVPRAVVDPPPGGGPAEGEIISDRTPMFRFDSAPAGATFECRMDDDAFAPCSGPGSHIHVVPTACGRCQNGGLTNGNHSFKVRATNGNGTGRSTVRNFIVQPPGTPPPPGGQGSVPANPATTTPPQTSPSPARVALLVSTITASRLGLAPVTLSCPRTATAACRGTLTLTTVNRIGISAVGRRLKLGSKTFRIPAGKRVKVQVKLVRKGFALLKRRRKLKVVAEARMTGPARTTVRRTITLRARAR